jgi:hypothetical protein
MPATRGSRGRCDSGIDGVRFETVSENGRRHPVLARIPKVAHIGPLRPFQRLPAAMREDQR